MIIDARTIGLRILDIEHGFRATAANPVVHGELASTLLLGKSLNLALHLRGLNVIPATELKNLRYAAAGLDIGSTELDTVLRELQELGWVRLKETAKKIERIEIVIPTLRDGFETVGERWKELSPTELEEACITALADAVVHPYNHAHLTSDLGMDSRIAGQVVGIGEAGTFLKVHRLDDGQKIIFSPLFGDANPEKAYEIAEKYGGDAVKALIKSVKETQGVPEEQLRSSRLINDAIASGLILTPAVKDKRFVFTPQRGLAQEESVILDKARAIVSCIRYGENFAEITKIAYPRAIIDALISKKKLKPHSEHLEQYGLLVQKGIGKVDKVGSMCQFSIVDTDDNVKALRVARDLLDTGDAVHQQLDDATKVALINPSASYSTPVIERTKLSRQTKVPGTDAQTTKAISALIRGAYHE